MRPKKQSDSEKYPEVPDPNHTNDLGRRIASLESSIIEIRKSHLEGHKWFTTVMFTLVAVLLTVLGTVSKTDVRDAIRDMKSESRDSTKDMQATVDFAVSDMDRKFQALSGEALKRHKTTQPRLAPKMKLRKKRSKKARLPLRIK